ncbi:glycine betaine ABC transporter substrate-binding protein [Variovorax sp. J22P168]|uniref:glycine betaine ABC transporter substrate-binding protein n=1 Tax=Variovorax jilinensis TaxID=3053513 RepID=UPI0025776EE6|nr:glycine betaine ABC transporter substrate-binding protein [Variovorax sp. J22P168]MDM0015316.1 glycine betaine ABC transporter substrate-binding protein [Variovorax sp. J22P168]
MSNSSSLTRRRALVVGAASAVGSLAPAQGRVLQRVTLGQVSLSFYAVTGAVVQAVLERLGHPVQLRTGPHDEMFPLLSQGSIDLMAAAWLPEGHATYWAQYGAEAIEVARLYEGAHFFWAVPSYVPENEVRSIGDLARPDVARRMTRQIQGIGTGATITAVSQTAVRAYGLDALGYAVRPGTQAEWIDYYEAAVRERRWFVFPTWAPQYLNRGGQLRALRDTQNVLGGSNRAALVAPTARWQSLPASTRVALSKVSLGLDAVNEMDWLVNVEKIAPREAASVWIRANEPRFTAWVQG